MPLLSSVVAAVLGSLAKQVAAGAFSDSSILAGIIPDAVDTIKEPAIDAVTRRKFESRVRSIGRREAAKVLNQFNEKGGFLDATRRRAIITELVKVMLTSEITADTLVSLNLDPAQLKRYLYATCATSLKEFSEAESRLFVTMLDHVSVAIINAAAETEGFSARVFSSILQTQSVVVEHVGELTARDRKEAREFEKRYKDEVRRKLDRMDLFGVKRVDELHRMQSLSLSFVRLSMEHDRSNLEPPTLLSPDLALTENYTNLPLGYSSRIDEILSTAGRVVVRGDAGSGKTTFLQWLAVRAGSEDFPEPLGSLNQSGPFFVRLREHTATGFPKPESFVSNLAPMLAGQMPHGWVHANLEAGRGLVLIDGVDEMPREKRTLMLEALQELIRMYPQSKYCITSRPAALKREIWPEWQTWIHDESFEEVSLQPMGPEQIKQFIDYWHRAVAETNDRCGGWSRSAATRR
jgi:hypothetical protein